MITRLTLKNFKCITEQVYDFTMFDLLVGSNNSGKSSVLQALAIWQFCIDEFRRSSRSGIKGIQVVLPNFTALPLPEFNLLWNNKTDRHWPLIEGKKKQEYILISICVEWLHATGKKDSFGVELRYHSPQTIYAIPSDGWAKFRELDKNNCLPIIAYVPPFSGLEPAEQWMDISPVRQHVGKGQPGSVLRNLLLRVNQSNDREKDITLKSSKPASAWGDLTAIIERWFSVELHEPKYDSAKDVYINVEYKQNEKNYDIISGGSGFHQVLTLLAFLYGYHPTTILLDEPDAHLHVHLQREIVDYFKRKSSDNNIQFLIATHAEEFVKGVNPTQIISLLSQEPKRIQSSSEVLRAMAEVSNEELSHLMTSPYILYVEGESDERVLRAWVNQCGAQSFMDGVYFKTMNGGDKVLMKNSADDHFLALRQVIPKVKRLMLFDYDEDKTYHPGPENAALFEWKRKNIENYLLVPSAWKRTALKELQCNETDLFAQPALKAIDDFFIDENLTLPPGKTWVNVNSNIFKVLDGKKILFENDNSLFQQLQACEPNIKLLRELVALNMLPEEIHEDVHQFFGELHELVESN